MVNLLLVDSELESLHTFLLGVNADTKCVIYSKFDTIYNLKSNINLLGEYFFENVGFVFQESANNLFVNSNPFISLDNKNQINQNESTIFIKELIKNYSVKNLDFLACNLLSRDIWRAYFDYILKENDGLILRASDDNTGNLFAGGDWILESTNEDIFNLYFNENLKNWNVLLDINYSNNYCVLSDGKLMGTSTNLYGEFGNNSYFYNPYFEQRNPISSIKKVICNYSLNTFVIKKDNTLWACGTNGWGQIASKNGFVRDKIENDFIQCSQLNTMITDVSDVVCGEYHTVVLKNDGSVWTCGRNTEGQLGSSLNFNTSEVTNNAYFTKVNINNVKQVSAGRDFTYFLKTDGTLYSCGNNLFGCLSRKDVSNGIVQAPLLNKTADIGQCVDINNNPLTNVEKVSCGHIHVIIKKFDGSIFLVGNNTTFQLGRQTESFNSPTISNQPTPYFPYFFENNSIDEVYDIFASYYVTYVIKKDGSLWGCGNGGTVANGGIRNNNGTIDTENFVQCKFISNKYVKNVKEISYGGGNTLILLKDGTVWATGYMDNGRSGIGEINNQNINVYYFTQCKTDKNNYLKNIKQIYGGSFTSFALTNDDKLLSCGTPGTSNSFGTSESVNKYKYNFVKDPTSKEIIKNVVKVLNIDSGILILKNDGTVWLLAGNTARTSSTFGSDTLSYSFIQMKYYDQGRIDNISDIIDMTCGANPNSTGTAVFTGQGYIVLLKKDRTVWSIGYNLSGQLGIGVSTFNPNYFMKANISDVMAIAAGGAHVLALKYDGSVWGCGSNFYGQLGIGTTSSIPVTDFTRCDINTEIIAIDCGINHSVILDSMGKIYACGHNNLGQLGIGTYDTSKNIFTICKVDNGTDDITDVKAICCNFNITQVIREINNNTTVYSCGSNSYGQFSNGNFDSIPNIWFMPSLVNSQTPLTNVVGIKTKLSNTQIIINANNTYKLMAVGLNIDGRLGNNQIVNNTTVPQTYFGLTVGIEGKPIMSSVSKLYNLISDYDYEFTVNNPLIYFSDAINKNIYLKNVTKISKTWKKPLNIIKIEPAGIRFSDHLKIGPILSNKVVIKGKTKPVKIYFKSEDGTITKLTTDITKNTFYSVLSGVGLIFVHTRISGEIGFTV